MVGNITLFLILGAFAGGIAVPRLARNARQKSYNAHATC